VSGLSAIPSGTLADRALELLVGGPRSAEVLSREVFGMARAPIAVAERLAVALLGADPRIRRLPDGRWSLVAQAAGSPLIEDASFAVVDVETTGGRSGGADRITEVAVVVVQGARCELAFESLVNPERPIPAMVTAVTRITDQMVRSAPTFDLVADRVIDALAGRVFVAHNARFDWPFIVSELKRAKALGLDGQRLCTVRLARNLIPGLPSYGLDQMAHYFGFENPARHRAGGDALVTGLLLQRLLELARGREARTLADLEQLQLKRKKKKRRGKRRSSAPEDSI
jgi:DNA polymerase-3 subunit epsilon